MFQGRPRSREITSDEYLLVALRYIHLNPVHSGLVKNPGEWQFSDYGEWISNKPISHISKIEKTRRDFRDHYFASGAEYHRFIFENMNETQKQYWSNLATQEEVKESSQSYLL